jgi:MFS family permease
MKDLLRNRVFQIIMATDTIQQMSIWIRNMAVLFFVIEQTNANPVAISLITIFEYLPIFVFSYFGGAMADKWNPKKTMIIGDSFGNPIPDCPGILAGCFCRNTGFFHRNSVFCPVFSHHV